MPQKNSVMVILTMPLLVFIMAIGWLLMRVDLKQKPIKTKNSEQTSKRAGSSLAMIPEEQKISA